MTDPDHLPADLAARVRVYLEALLTAREVDPAMDELASDVGYWGDDRPVDVFAAARTIVHSRIRVADDLEALVLHEDADLSVDEIAKVMKRGPADVRALLDTAAATLAEPLDGPSVADATPRRAVAPTAETRTARRVDSEPVDPDEAVAPGPTDAADAAVAARPDTIDSPTDPSTERPASRPAIRIDADAPADEAPHEPSTPATGADGSRSRVAFVAAVSLAIVVSLVLVGALVIALWPDGSASPCPEDTAVCIDEAVMTTGLSEDRPDEARDTFQPTDDVRIWFSFTRAPSAGDPQVEVRWYRGEALLYRSPFQLPAGDHGILTLAKLFMTEPGDYRVEILSGGEVVAEESFRIVTAEDA